MPPKPKLPQYVSVKNGKYIYRPYIKKKHRGKIHVDKYGYASPIILCPADAPTHKMYACLASAEQQLQFEKMAHYLSLRWLYREYTNSHIYKKLQLSTQKRYSGCSVILRHSIEINGQNANVGDIQADEITRVQIRRILDRRMEQYNERGKKGSAQCNNELALLSAMFKYGTQYIDELAQINNPCHGISKYRVDARQRYVTEADYKKQYAIAGEVRTYLPVVMELSYLLAARGIEVHDLKIEDAGEEGVIVERRKGSRTTIVRWSERLLAAWQSAIDLHQKTPQPNQQLIVNEKGKKIAKSSIDWAWQELKNEMEARGLSAIYFQWHDLKRKGISDASDNKIAGHRSESVRDSYDVKIDSFDAPD